MKRTFIAMMMAMVMATSMSAKTSVNYNGNRPDVKISINVNSNGASFSFSDGVRKEAPAPCPEAIHHCKEAKHHKDCHCNAPKPKKHDCKRGDREFDNNGPDAIRMRQDMRRGTMRGAR